jgi:alkylhydroperoxidase family enzyme
MRLDGVLAAIARWLAAFFSRRQQQDVQDATAITRNQEAAHAAHDAQAAAPASRAVLADGVRTGRDF